MEGESLLLSHPGLPLIALFSHKMLLNIKRSDTSSWPSPKDHQNNTLLGKKDVQITGLPSNPQSYLLFPNYKMIIAGYYYGIFPYVL